MRIIGGIHRSRTLLAPRDSQTTRPITDRVKQSLFDRLWSGGWIGQEQGGNVADVFAGTGSMGLEALSRGANHCVFIEKDRHARLLLEKNIQALELHSQSTVLNMDALSGAWIGVLPSDARPLRVIFLDPPYVMLHDQEFTGRIAHLIQAFSAPDLMESNGLIVLRTDDRAQPPVAPQWPNLQSFAYGSMVLHFYQRV